VQSWAGAPQKERKKISQAAKKNSRFLQGLGEDWALGRRRFSNDLRVEQSRNGVVANITDTPNSNISGHG
jgi:hypothetical protein